MKNYKVYIIILNWNGYNDTIECISSIAKIEYTNYKILIVDNGSDTNEIDSLISMFPTTKILKSEKNLGYAGGNNLGIKYALNEGADFILILNNDTVVESSFLKPLLDIFYKNEKVGIAAPQINYYSNPEIIWTNGGKISKIRGSGFAYSNKNDVGIEKKESPVTFASGCCLLIKREVFEKIGLFDEKFFLYVEDADFCYRARKAGYKIIVTNYSKIYHKVGRSSSEDSKQVPIYYTTRNRLFFAKKNFHNFYIITFIYILTAMSFKALFWLIKSKTENIYSVKQAFVDFLKGEMGKINNEKFMIKR